MRPRACLFIVFLFGHTAVSSANVYDVGCNSNPCCNRLTGVKYDGFEVQDNSRTVIFPVSPNCGSGYLIWHQSSRYISLVLKRSGGSDKHFSLCVVYSFRPHIKAITDVTGSASKIPTIDLFQACAKSVNGQAALRVDASDNVANLNLIEYTARLR